MGGGPNPWNWTDLSSACVFRAIPSRGVELELDEVKIFFGKKNQSEERNELAL